MQNEIKKPLTYQRTILHQNESFEIVSIQWQQGSISEMHNHGDSQCLVLIEEGVFENTLDLGNKKEIQLLEVGQVLNTPYGARHEMRCQSAIGKTLHVYTPKIIESIDQGRFNPNLAHKMKDQLKLDEPTRLDVLNHLLSDIKSNSISTNSPFFMNQLFSGVSPQMLLAENLIMQTKTTLATHEASPVFSQIEAEVIQRLGSLIGWPEGHQDGVTVPGGSAANFMALHCARQKYNPEIKKTGLSGEKFKIFVSREAHYSFKKACVALGFGTDSLVLVPSQKNGKMNTDQLEKLITDSVSKNEIPLLVCATAGTTVLGAFDPIDAMAAICKKHNIWLHVDGAWGGPALFSSQIKHLMSGVHLADSVTFDAHKLFGASLTSSFFLTSHTGLLLESNDVSGGDYLFHGENEFADRGKMSWQCGRKADATSFWTIWKSLGTNGLGDFVDRLLAIKDQTVAWAQTEPRLQLVADPDFLNICIRIEPPASDRDITTWSQHVREQLKEQNQAMVNYSTDSNGHFLRLILAHPYLEFKHVQQILQWSLAIQ